jgi:hypothetical protein
MDLLLVPNIRVVDEITAVDPELVCMREEWHGRGGS